MSISSSTFSTVRPTEGTTTTKRSSKLEGKSGTLATGIDKKILLFVLALILYK